MKNTSGIFCLTAALTLAALTSSCCIRDWYHDWRYGNQPVPTEPITPPAPPQPGDYAQIQAINVMTDSLLFFLSTVSDHGRPVVTLLTVNDHSAYEVERRLIASNAVRRSKLQTDEAPVFKLFSKQLKDSWNLRLVNEREKTVFNQTLKKRGTW